jgi:hypothetical protein
MQGARGIGKNIQNFLGKPEGKRPRGRFSMDWIHLAQDKIQWWALVNTVRSLRGP